MSKIESKKSFSSTFPRLPVYEQVGEYLSSVGTGKQALLPGSVWDKASTDPDTYLVKCQRLLAKEEINLAEKRQFYKKAQVAMKQQWNDLEQQEKTLRDHFDKLNLFIKSNKGKRERATERIHEDVKTIEKLDRQIEQLKVDCTALEQIKLVIEKEIGEHMVYQQYLHRVIDLSVEFKSPASIIDRYESLISTKTELGNRQACALETLEFLKHRLLKMNDENKLRILGLANTVSNCVSRYQIAVTNSLHWERIVNSIKVNSHQQFKQITEVKQCCRNTYLLMCKRKGDVSNIPEDNIEQQLVYIKRTLKQLAYVRAQAEKRMRKSFSSTKVETSFRS